MPLDQGESLTTRLNTKYRYGFRTKVSSVQLPPGLSENTVRWLVEQRKEPKFMLKWRLEGFRALKKMQQPTWGKLNLKPIDLQKISYYSAPKSVARKAPRSLNEVDPKLLDAYKKLGIPLHEQYKLAGVAVDAVFDSVSVATTFKANLAELGVIFCPFSEALKLYPELVEKYLGSVVSNTDNYFAALNAAVFSDGSFVYIPKGVHCPIELSTYFRINAAKTGQFERTLIVADENSFVSYLEGCSAPARDTNQLHAAVVELVALDRAEIKYATVQNWYPGDSKGRGGIFNLVTKRGECRGAGSHISWTQLETGSAITWKYPSTILKGEGSHSEFYSVAITNNYQQADTGSKMIHLGANTRSLIISKGISAGGSTNTYRGLVSINKSASGAYNYTKCDSLIMGKLAKAHTFPKIVNETESATTEHEASTTKISAEQLFYCQQRGLDEKDSLSLIVNGFCREVFQKLPMEFMVEAYKLVELTLEGAYQC